MKEKAKVAMNDIPPHPLVCPLPQIPRALQPLLKILPDLQSRLGLSKNYFWPCALEIYLTNICRRLSRLE